MKIALITDTASDIPQGWIDQYNVHMLHFQIIYSDCQYRDQIEISSEKVFENFAKETPTTSMPLLGDVQDLFQKLSDEGYTHAIAITISSGLSGTWNSLNLIKDDFPNLETHVYDSKTLSFGQAALVELAGKMIADHKTLDEIIPALDYMQANQRSFFIVDTLKYLVAGGRIGHVSGIIGTVLNLKPIISIGTDGKYVTETTVRGKKRALAAMVKSASEVLVTRQCKIYVLHGDAEADAHVLIEQLKKLPNVVGVTFDGYIGPVACVHTGPGFLGMVLVEA